ncbi:MAG: endo alpha-1,4 polygalactosaminidase [Candidatus Odinarchaeota archaeon]|nr:endo alpha-1,4 polygalactosaminidase [Candidatus Odinarchaeota archaeon]
METPFDVVVIDYSRDGTDEQAFTYQEIQQLKQSNGGKIVLSYLSIGEAENYRYYWNQSWDANNDSTPDEDAPDWLQEENPEWEGNYAVKYWDPE